jgi:hypothetical protein
MPTTVRVTGGYLTVEAAGRPDQGLPGGGHYPDQGLPGGGHHPDQGLPPGIWGGSGGLPGQPPYPSQGLPPFAGQLPSGGGNRPDNTLPPWQGQPPTVWPPGPVDPEWGVPAGEAPSHPIYIPVYPDNTLPGEPPRVDNTLPEVPGHPPPADAPPGTVYPPIAGAPAGNAWLKTETIPGVGHRYVMATFPESGAPDQGLPGGPEGQPPRPDQGLPPTAGQLPSGPPTAQPRR